MQVRRPSLTAPGVPGYAGVLMENERPQIPVNIPVNPPQAGWRPTNSTTLAVVAGAATQVIAKVCEHFGLVLDGVTQGSITVLIMAAVSYIHPDGGRK